jgi:hypothetical protein
MVRYRIFAGVCAAALAAVASPGALAAKATYSKDVAPILNAKCVVCHRAGEIAPMSLTSYDEVRPWVKAIAENVGGKVMPPWHADQGFGPFANDRSLTREQIDTIVAWANAGAPQGDVKDLPPLPAFPEGEWRLGEPDTVIEFEEVTIDGTGPDQFRNLVGKTGFTEDKWITGVEIQPGDRKVVHHVILWQGGQGNPDGWIGAWAAGAAPQMFPAGTGRELKKGQALVGDMHYHPYGEDATDRTRVGLHLADNNEVEKQLVNLWVINVDFEIPAGDPNYEARSTYTFAQDSHILSLTPHMHFRGKDFNYRLTRPDGSTEELLKVSKYDFNWQTGYEFVEPVAVPAGSRMDCVAHWDNSPENEANPDPARNVRFGNESYDEMMIGFVDYIVDEGVRPKPTDSPVLAKLDELAIQYPGEVYKVMIQNNGKFEPSAVHLPREGEGGWHINLGPAVGRAPITDIVWTGDEFTAIARIPGEDPMNLSGSVDSEGIKLKLPVGPGGQTITLPGKLAQ